MKVFVVLAAVLLAVNAADDACYIKTRGQCRPQSNKPGMLFAIIYVCVCVEIKRVSI